MDCTTENRHGLDVMDATAPRWRTAWPRTRSRAVGGIFLVAREGFSVATFEAARTDLDGLRCEWADQFPGAHFGCIWDINPPLLNALRAALVNGSEESIQKVLTANPYLIQYAVDRSGHHGIWVFPKPMIRPKGVDGTPGLVPDYLVVTRSSLGYLWHVVEIKRFNVQFGRSDGCGESRW
jgi:hypothetical protein